MTMQWAPASKMPPLPGWYAVAFAPPHSAHFFEFEPHAFDVACWDGTLWDDDTHDEWCLDRKDSESDARAMLPFKRRRSDGVRMGTGPVELAWVIERGPAEKPDYLMVDMRGLSWTRDPMLAIRLSRQVDADALAELMHDAERVAEHAWEVG